MDLQPHEKQHLIKSLERAINILQSLPDKKECATCEFCNISFCTANQNMQIPPHIKPNGCNAWEWNGVPF